LFLVLGPASLQREDRIVNWISKSLVAIALAVALLSITGSMSRAGDKLAAKSVPSQLIDSHKSDAPKTAVEVNNSTRIEAPANHKSDSTAEIGDDLQFVSFEQPSLGREIVTEVASRLGEAIGGAITGYFGEPLPGQIAGKIIGNAVGNWLFDEIFR
jgi:hypothetical protein